MLNNRRILLVEDDTNLGFVVKDNLQMEGFDVTLCANGQQAIEAFDGTHYDLCVLDVMLPKIDGFQLAAHIRNSNKEIPIIFLTAKSMIDDKLEGFKKGGDDYLTKPFSMEELIYRIQVFLKRSMKITSSDLTVFQIGAYTFNFDNLNLSKEGEIQNLTLKEASVLQLFCMHEGEVLKREFILKEIWGSDDYFLGRSMDVFISKLRKYLKKDSSIQIVNYHGIGFKFSIENKN